MDTIFQVTCVNSAVRMVFTGGRMNMTRTRTNIRGIYVRFQEISDQPSQFSRMSLVLLKEEPLNDVGSVFLCFQTGTQKT